jgi:phospholipase C
MQTQRITGGAKLIRVLAATVFFCWMALTALAQTGTIQDVQHVVILMQENRSMDHYCGTMPGVRGYGDRNALAFNGSQSDFYQPWGWTNILPFPLTNQCIEDVDHDEMSGLEDWDNGKWDMWVPAKGFGAMSYCPANFVPLQSALAQSYTICDNYFCSLIGPTYPNRLYLFSGMIDPNGTAGGPAVENFVPLGGFRWTTYPELLEQAGVSWRVYRPMGDWFGDVLPWFAQFTNALPGSPLYDRGVAEVPDVVAALEQDVVAGKLPKVSWIIPTLDQSGHPPYSPADGEVFIQNVLGALQANPAVFNSTVFIVTYDENGGFFDHIPSPIAPPGTSNEFINGKPLGLGVRVPTLIISPWSRGGKVCSQVFDHTSIIRFLEQWTGVKEPNISAWRRQVCGDLTSAFDFTQPDTNAAPALPEATWFEDSPYYPYPPALQNLPVQPTNPMAALPLPYQPEITAHTDCGNEQIHLVITNSGAASVHFAIYANPVQNSGPIQCDAAAGSSLTENLAVPAASFGHRYYDYTCCGPDGFQRRFAGNLAADCGQIEAISSIDTNADAISVVTENSSATAVKFVITDAYGIEGPWTNTVPAGSSATNVISSGFDNSGWYDLTVTASSDGNFLRRFTGHIENGMLSLTEPVLLPPPPPSAAAPVTLVPTVLTNSAGVLSLLASIPTSPPTNALTCYNTVYNSNMVMVFPAWASHCTILASPSLDHPKWTPTNVVLTNMGNYIAASMPLSGQAMFYILSQTNQ